MNPPYYSLSTYLRGKYGCRVQKIPLDAGFSCPNRDGTISDQGCVFCNPLGSGTGMRAAGLSLEAQWDRWKERLKKKYKAELFWAYLQSFTNTYAPIERIREVLNEISGLEGLAGLSLGTRPDCLDPEKLDLIKAFPSSEIWLEIGMQSASNQTLKIINRGHDLQILKEAVETAAARKIKICLHLILGLPGEKESDFLNTIDSVNSLPVRGVKFHNLYVCRDTTLARWWREGRYTPISRLDYLDWLTRGLRRLRPDIVVQRLNGDPRPGELLAPSWAAEKSLLLRDIRTRLEEKGWWQGQKYAAAAHPPPGSNRTPTLLLRYAKSLLRNFNKSS